MASIVGNDLRNSGMFEPIPRQNMISLPNRAEEVIYRDWQALGAQYVLVGNLVPVSGRLQVQFALFNVITQQQVLAGSVTGASNQLRDMAHHIADQAFEKLTGTKGAFSTRLLYVTAERMGVNNTRYTLQRSDYDGARAVTLLQSREPILSPRYAPDGKRIAYVSFEQTATEDLHSACRYRTPRADHQFRRLERRAGLFAGRQPPGVRAIQGRQSGNLRDGSGQPPDAADHQPLRHRHRTLLGARRANLVFHVRPCGAAANL